MLVVTLALGVGCKRSVSVSSAPIEPGATADVMVRDGSTGVIVSSQEWQIPIRGTGEEMSSAPDIDKYTIVYRIDVKPRIIPDCDSAILALVTWPYEVVRAGDHYDVLKGGAPIYVFDAHDDAAAMSMALPRLRRELQDRMTQYSMSARELQRHSPESQRVGDD